MTFVPDEPFTSDVAQVTSKLNRLRVGPGLPVSTLANGSDMHAVVPASSATVTSKWAKDTGGPSGDEAQNLIQQVAHTLRGEGCDASEDGTGRGTPLVAQPVYGMTGGTGDESAFPEQQPALTASHGQPGNVAVPAVLLTMREGKDGGGKGPLLAEDESLTLATGNGQVLFDPQGIAENQRGEVVATDYVHAVTSGGGKPGQGYPAVHESYGVRRLTPTECERLQAFPDGWTEPAGSDSARYRALGNAVTVNVPQWLFARMLEVGT